MCVFPFFLDLLLYSYTINTYIFILFETPLYYEIQNQSELKLQIIVKRFLLNTGSEEDYN